MLSTEPSNRAEQALTEGRDAIQALRSSTVVTNELAQAVTALGKRNEPRGASQDSAHGSARFDVVVEGPPRDLHPILRDEVYAIVREAVRNAFRHAQAQSISKWISGIAEVRSSCAFGTMERVSTRNRSRRTRRPLWRAWNARARQAHWWEAGRMDVEPEQARRSS